MNRRCNRQQRSPVSSSVEPSGVVCTPTAPAHSPTYSTSPTRSRFALAHTPTSPPTPPIHPLTHRPIFSCAVLPHFPEARTVPEFCDSSPGRLAVWKSSGRPCTEGSSAAFIERFAVSEISPCGRGRGCAPRGAGVPFGRDTGGEMAGGRGCGLFCHHCWMRDTYFYERKREPSRSRRHGQMFRRGSLSYFS